MTLMIGASALGRAWRTITRQRGTPLRRAISIYCEAMRLMIATRVMRIMWAVTTSVSVSAGSTVR